MKNLVCIAILFGSLCVLNSCGGGGNNSTGGGSSVINVAGNWQFTVSSTVFGGSETATGEITQKGSSLSGALSGLNCAQTANLAGSLSGTSINATLDENGQSVSLKGTVSSDGNSGTGTYIAPDGGCTNGDAGTFVGQRLSMLNGMFVGSFGPENAIRANLVTQLHDDGGNVTGSATVTNSLCFHSLNVRGKVSGFNVELQGTEGPGGPQTISLHGTFDKLNKTLTLEYAVTGGSCSAETGTAQLRSLTNHDK
ncbi:MAG: hypothetical protein WA734_02525 [Candidatus Acidiferrales bacterium]